MLYTKQYGVAVPEFVYGNAGEMIRFINRSSLELVQGIHPSFLDENVTAAGHILGAMPPIAPRPCGGMVHAAAASWGGTMTLREGSAVIFVCWSNCAPGSERRDDDGTE